MIDGSTVDSIEISSDKGMKIRISKSPQQRGAVQIPAPVQMPAMVPRRAGRAADAAEAMPAVGDGEPARAEAPKPQHARGEVADGGHVLHAPEPGAKPYVAVGTRVAKGQILCIIEAMKIMNEIESEYAGVVQEILVQDAQPVEYGQVLFRIDPNG